LDFDNWGNSDKETKERLDAVSASMCLAKWYNATIWLGSGMTTSCHHPPAHKVSLNSVETNPKALHNTPEKKKDRAMMQQGQRPLGCEYCWKIEDMGRDAISDRVYKSKIFEIKDLTYASKLAATEDVDLKTLEIAFDRTCQFACSYCNPAFSSTWVKDIRTNGPYVSLESDGRNHFTHPHDSAQLYKFGETNPYIEAFFKWWESDLHKTLTELRITGGEPLMSAHTWRLIEWFKDNPKRSQTRLAINSNLGFDSATLNKFIDAIKDLPQVELYTSMEATGIQAEYIRDGLNYEQWRQNVERLLETDAVKAIHCMCTINALCLDSLPAHLNYLMDIKQRYGRERMNFTLNILRFPSFQSPLVLPDTLRTKYRNELQQWLDQWRNSLLTHEHERNHTRRLVDYLDVVKTPHCDAFDMPRLHNDFKQFYQQYDLRRNKHFQEAFPTLLEWYQKL
jgi:organic radical activating enzyme